MRQVEIEGKAASIREDEEYLLDVQQDWGQVYEWFDEQGNEHHHEE
jgi:hypothetical protein